MYPVKNSPFIIPKSIAPQQQLSFCLSVIDRYRHELPELRILTTQQADWQKKHDADVAD